MFYILIHASSSVRFNFTFKIKSNSNHVLRNKVESNHVFQNKIEPNHVFFKIKSNRTRDAPVRSDWVPIRLGDRSDWVPVGLGIQSDWIPIRLGTQSRLGDRSDWVPIRLGDRSDWVSFTYKYLISWYKINSVITNLFQFIETTWIWWECRCKKAL